MLAQTILGSDSEFCSQARLVVAIFVSENKIMSPSLSSQYDHYDSFQRSTEWWDSCFVGLESINASKHVKMVKDKVF